MKLPRIQRSWLAIWLAVALLCMQVTAAAHAYPRAASAGMAAMADCADAMDHDAAPELLSACKAHCQQGSAAVDNATPLLDAPALVALYLAPMPASPTGPLQSGVRPFAGTPPPADAPLALRPHILRI